METNRRSFHGHDLRKGRCSIPGQIYLVTTVTKDRVRIFDAFWRARLASRCLHDPVVTRHGETLAFVIMPDHVHWLLQLRDAGELSAAVRLFKAKVSRQIGHRVWQRGFHDRALRTEEDVVAVARYVIANPLRAGLVRAVGDYPHWDAVWLTGAP